MPNDKAQYSDEDSFIRRLDPDYIALITDSGDAKTRLDKLQALIERLEGYIVGAWQGTARVPGLRDDMKEQKDLTVALDRKVESTKADFAKIKAGVWAIFLVLAGIFGKSIIEMLPAFQGHIAK